ncbi:platelet-activating factor receptor [Pristis pectinata]|uniref:platelet-activating factor receptor n=1 Tax=Pristis pectinata TaxID=685728 RepID=UPI00223DE4FD|nr:platelet-activating factor receptor [Pristis pectinata]XP_051892264.1 platelet-activating factor receptor [Pristis pectinata]XP_051892265.1 platelet-activating factor receptor [Pristis pectinata]XP_051892266.1 platelet-activating factor receptor [Pristis pectinata]XP_051892267.1 platelet-activating factor receptor [Pristis pectinata]XP_051892268.1 platelet-activating factor receptor [Pristis pectinata]XP_051892269.1 platelet-activating factor receptor [Pristis pectinata]XP_051892270.1 pla
MNLSAHNNISSNITGNGRNVNCQIDAEFRYILFPIVYTVVFILGVLENCYVLWIFKYLTPSRNTNEIKILMVNLSVADLLFILTLPLWVIYYIKEGDWIFSEIVCRLAGCLFFINTYCSIAFLAVISYNRYCAVAYPIETIQSTGRKRGCIISTVIWVIIAVSATPFLFQQGTNEVGEHRRCFEGYSKDISVVAINFVLVGAFFIAFLVVIICNVRILSLLSSQPAQPRKSRKVRMQAFRMVCTVIIVFLICFVPHHLVQGPWTLTVLEMWRKDDCVFRRQVNNAHQITLCLMGLNCTLDPIIYCFLTQKFRKFFTHSLKRWKSARKSTQTISCETNLGEIGLQSTSVG